MKKYLYFHFKTYLLFTNQGLNVLYDIANVVNIFCKKQLHTFYEVNKIWTFFIKRASFFQNTDLQIVNVKNNLNIIFQNKLGRSENADIRFAFFFSLSLLVILLFFFLYFHFPSFFFSSFFLFSFISFFGLSFYASLCLTFYVSIFFSWLFLDF